MNKHPRILQRVFGPGLLAIGMSLLLSQTGLSQPAQLSQAERDKQVAEIEKQIAALQSQLKNMKERELLPVPKLVSEETTLPADWAKAMKWRNIGPSNMGGRITALAVFEADPSTFWVATASGGLLKTTNNGSTFEHQFDKEATVSIGHVAVAPSDRNVVWVGTGEANPRNSVSYGDGVYKSIDGGKTWQNMGLRKSYQIGSIAIHPTNPNIVYIGALGRLYGTNEERGLFKTEDGGKTWNRVLYVDDKTGVMDIAMHPKEPDTLLVATWERQRDEFDSFKGDSKKPDGADEYAPVKPFGVGSGVWKTSDGGKNFRRISKGLPTVKLGRIGLDYYRASPNVVFALVDSEDVGKGSTPATVYLGFSGETNKDGGVTVTTVAADGPAEKAGLKEKDLMKKLDGKELKEYPEVMEFLRPKKVGDKIKIDVVRGKDNLSLEATLIARNPGGTTPKGKDGGGGRQRPTIGVQIEEVEGGLKVTEVVEKGSADKAGIKVDDILVSLDGTDLENQRVLQKMMFTKNAGEKVKLAYLRGKDKKEVELTLELPVTNTARPYGHPQLGGQRENVQDQQGADGFQTGGLFKSTDGGESWSRVNSINPRPFYFSLVRVDPQNDKNIWVGGIDLKVSSDGGRTFGSEFAGKGPDGKDLKHPIDRGVHSDHHALWIDPRDGRHLIMGTDGGFYLTYDRGANWEHLNHFALGQFYHVVADNQRPYNVYGGLQDNGSWGGPAQTFRNSGPTNSDFTYILGGDGFVCRVDANNPNLVYAESQDGNMMRRDLKTGASSSIRPRSFAGTGTYRWNWNTPFILSSHNPSIFYCAANYVFRSVKQGDDLKIISPEITLTKHGTGTALAESPKNPEVIWAGTDDGAVWVTRDGGKAWNNVSENFKKAGLPGPRWVSSIEPSRYDEKRAYVVFDAHRSNDDEPYLFVTDDYGVTWKSIRGNLPVGSSRVLREDIVASNLLYLGTEFACWVSLDRGQSWSKLNGDSLPTVAIHEFAQPGSASDLVAATHGRSLWILDVTTLRQLSVNIVRGKTMLFVPAGVTRWQPELGKEGMFSTGTRSFKSENPPRGTNIDYVLENKASKVSLKIQDIAGKSVREMETKTSPGFHRAYWDLRRVGGGGGRFGQEVPPGQYRIVLNVDGQEFVQSVLVEADPRSPKSAFAVDAVEEERTLKKMMKELLKSGGDDLDN